MKQTVTATVVTLAATCSLVVCLVAPAGATSRPRSGDVNGPAYQLIFAIQPPTTTVSDHSFDVVVDVEDQNGDVVTNESGRQIAVTITPGTGSAGSQVTCTDGGTGTVAGVDMLSCTLTGVGTGYQLTASSDVLIAAFSTPFASTAAISSFTSPGVIISMSPTHHSFVYKSATTAYKVDYTAKTTGSAEVEKVFAIGWHIIVKGLISGSAIAASKIVNDPGPERAACNEAANTVNTAVAAYEAESGGKIPPSVASLTQHVNGGPYLNYVPPNRTFYRIALNWGGKAPGKENGGKSPGSVDVASVWLGVVRPFVPYFSETPTTGCNAAT